MPEYRSIQGEIKLLEKSNDFLFPVEIWMLNDKVNRNNWKFVNLSQHKDQWAGVPILVAYVNGGRKTGDGHNQVTRIDRDGNEYQSFTDATAERICGSLSDDVNDIRLEERDGALWAVGRGALWAWYSHELCTQIADWARQGRTMSVSIEALVTESYMDGDVEVETSYIPLGVTLLGAGVAPAVQDAHIAMLSEIGEEFKELKLRAASYLNQSADNKPQNNPTHKELKHSMIYSKKQLAELQDKFGADYKVLRAESDGDVTRVKLMRRSDYGFLSYELGAKDSAILPEKFVNRSASIVLSAEAEDGSDEVCAEAGEIICEECAEAEAAKETACAESKRLSEELASVKSQLAAMQEFETKRRAGAARDHAKSILANYNANRAEKVSETVIASVISDAESGAYNDRMDKDGNWIGLAAVEKDVKALCADEQMKLDAKTAQASKTEFVWRGMSAANEALDDGSPAALIAAL